MRFLIFLVLLAAGFFVNAAGPVHAQASVVDLMCDHAPKGTVEPVPPPFDYWVVLVCGPQSQALVPIEGMQWLAHGTNETISILALPPGASPVPPAQDQDYVPSYRVRFKSLQAVEVTGDKRKRIMAMLSEHLARDAAPPPLPRIDHIFQLDAISSIYDIRYNIYFYVSGLNPLQGIACIDECKQTLFFDIRNDGETGRATPVPGLRPGQ